MQIGCAVIYQNKKLLLLKKAYGEFKNKYEFPGGKRTKYETIQDCVKREVWEEIGCLSNVENLLHYMKIPKGEIQSISTDLDVFFHFVKLTPNYKIKLSKEHSEYVWVTFKQAKKLNMLKWDYSLLNKFEFYFLGH